MGKCIFAVITQFGHYKNWPLSLALFLGAWFGLQHFNQIFPTRYTDRRCQNISIHEDIVILLLPTQTRPTAYHALSSILLVPKGPK